MCMKINNNHNQSFGCKRLYSVKVHKEIRTGVRQVLDGYVSELGKEDFDKFIGGSSDIAKTKLGGQIVLNFLDECKLKNSEIGKAKRYFVLELPHLSLQERFKGICLAEFQNGYIFISKLQSLAKEPKGKDLKGIGSCLVYAVSKLAQKTNQDSVRLSSNLDAFDFYRKLKFFQPKPQYNTFVLKTPKTVEFDEHLAKIADRFLIKPLNE